MNIVEQLPGLLASSGSLQVTPQVLDSPLPAVCWVVFVTMLLNADVGQMHKHVIELIDIGIIFHRAEATKAKLIQVALQWSVRRDQHINTQIELQ